MMTDQRFMKEQPRPEGKDSEKVRGRTLLIPPVRRLRMSRGKVEH